MAKLIGTDPNQVPTNADLGTMAYQDYDVVAPQFLAGRRNLIINGDFQVTQRGDYSSNTGVSQNTYYIDRWKHLVQVVTAQIRRDNGVIIDGKPMSVFRMEATSSATGRMGIRQTVEARGTRCPIEDGPATLSVWMRSTNPNACLLFYQYSGGGYIGHKPYTGGGEWQKLSLTVEASPSALTHSAVSLELNFGIHTATNGNVSITSGDYIEIAQPQLEAGKVATPFEHRSYGEELALCQRYYQEYGGSYYYPFTMAVGISSTLARSIFTFPVPMRAAPTFTSTNATSINIDGTSTQTVSSLTGDVSTPTSHMMNINTSTGFGADGTACRLYGSNGTYNALKFDAEL
jgi:hypothetical protein